MQCRRPDRTPLLAGLLLLALVTSPVAAQTISYEDFEDGFKSFASDLASGLPLNATIGNTWSDAYIGRLLGGAPHFGVGMTIGASTLPFDTVDQVFTDLGLDMPSDLESFSSYGVPFPAYTADVRLGGFGLPFDFGVKLGGLNSGMFASAPFDFEYLLAGADIRFALVEEEGPKPDVSIGIGYNYLYGEIVVPDVFGSTYSFEIPDGSGDTLAFEDPDLAFNWGASVIDLKAQVSKEVLILRPFAGFGASYSTAQAGGGLRSRLLKNGVPVTQGEIDAIEDQFADAGVAIPELDAEEGISVVSDVSGWGFRVFGGLGFNILLLKMDLSLGYDFLGQNLQAALGARVQL